MLNPSLSHHKRFEWSCNKDGFLNKVVGITLQAISLQLQDFVKVSVKSFINVIVSDTIIVYSVSHITRNLFLTGSSAVAEKHTGIIFKKCIVRGLNFICGDF